MSTRNLIDAIASGSALDIESAFEDTMAEKVSVQIEAKRLQIAQTMFTTEEVELDEEQLNELSVKTLSSYARKSAADGVNTAQHLGANKQRNMRQHGDMHNVHGDEDKQSWSQPSDEVVARKKLEKHLDKRGAGFNQAMKKIVKKTNEEVDLDEEQLDELSKGTLDSYRDAAVDHTDKIKKHVASMNQQVKSSIDMVKHYKTGSVADAHRGHVNDAKSELKTSKRLLKNRAAGIDRAGEKLAKNEEVDLDEEQLDELSKKTLGSYIKKSTDSYGGDSRSIGSLSTKAADKYNSGGEDEGGEEESKSYKRSKGIARAVNRLTKEEVDLDEEQSEQE